MVYARVVGNTDERIGTFGECYLEAIGRGYKVRMMSKTELIFTHPDYVDENAARLISKDKGVWRVAFFRGLEKTNKLESVLSVI